MKNNIKLIETDIKYYILLQGRHFWETIMRDTLIFYFFLDFFFCKYHWFIINITILTILGYFGATPPYCSTLHICTMILLTIFADIIVIVV